MTGQPTAANDLDGNARQIIFWDRPLAAALTGGWLLPKCDINAKTQVGWRRQLAAHTGAGRRMPAVMRNLLAAHRAEITLRPERALTMVHILFGADGHR